MRVGRIIARYLVGTILVGAIIAAGTAVRIVQFAQPNDAVAGDAIVVLGAAQYNGRPSAVFAARLDHAAALYRSGAAAHIVTVGGSQPGDATTEAAAGKAYLDRVGIPPAALLAVGVGNDTLVSLRAVGAALSERGWDSMVIVTDPWHEQRCRMIARDLGFAVEVSPVTQGPATTDSVEPRYVVREVLGTVFYRLVGGPSGAGRPVI